MASVDEAALAARETGRTVTQIFAGGSRSREGCAVDGTTKRIVSEDPQDGARTGGRVPGEVASGPISAEMAAAGKTNDAEGPATSGAGPATGAATGEPENGNDDGQASKLGPATDEGPATGTGQATNEAQLVSLGVFEAAASLWTTGESSSAAAVDSQYCEFLLPRPRLRPRPPRFCCFSWKLLPRLRCRLLCASGVTPLSQL